ncbi:Aste57867_820 [Aphanomyces stellatus]|uniref:Aste57867_820 protein n=1 Tax=Aphanomyces stellatus TaxID=120398 RepID=A0A485K691_9STRA|nr:hypothetical protein As57867_000819 [Aphanomyces stellatus]VFT78044.1 Aste57867_820 [Aphanomyces stellatus]
MESNNAVEKKLRRRAYMRNMMKIYRDEFKMEMAYLRSKESELEGQLRNILDARRALPDPTASSTNQLPWKEIALALKSEKGQTIDQLKELKGHVDEYHGVIRDMERWVATQLSIPRSPCEVNHTRTWRHTTLLAHPTSRELGKAWITEQMYHNTDRMLQQYQFRNVDAPHELYDIDVVANSDSGAYEYIHRRQFDIDLPASLLMTMYRDIICSLLVIDHQRPVHTRGPPEESGHTRLHCMSTAHETVRLLTGEFHEARRSVFVAQQIQTDELDTPWTGGVQRNRSIWTEVHSISPTKSRLRTLYFYSQLVAPDGQPLPFEYEARSWDFDPSDADDEVRLRAKFRNHLIHASASLLPVAQQRVVDYLTCRAVHHERMKDNDVTNPMHV